MLQEVYDAQFIKDRYKCGSLDTARRYMRQMGAKGRPLFVTEDMIVAWEATKRNVRDCSGRVVARLRTPGTKIPRRK